MIVIAENAKYKLGFSVEKNRFYLSIFGHWATAEEVPNYFRDWEKGLAHAKPSFTILADIRQMFGHSPEVVQELHVPMQRRLIVEGLLVTADVIPKSLLAEGQVDVIATKSGMRKGKFYTVEQAELWLDSLAKGNAEFPDSKV